MLHGYVTFREVPGLIDFLSYMLHFQAVLTGPFCFYTDYLLWLKGTNAIGRNGKAYREFLLILIIRFWIDIFLSKVRNVVCCEVRLACYKNYSVWMKSPHVFSHMLNVEHVECSVTCWHISNLTTSNRIVRVMFSVSVKLGSYQNWWKDYTFVLLSISFFRLKNSGVQQ